MNRKSLTAGLITLFITFILCVVVYVYAQSNNCSQGMLLVVNTTGDKNTQCMNAGTGATKNLSFGTATQNANILAGSTIEVPIVFDGTQPNASYNVTGGIEATSTILSSSKYAGVKAGSKTTTGCTIVIQNTGLATILSGSITVNIIAYQ